MVAPAPVAGRCGIGNPIKPSDALPLWYQNRTRRLAGHSRNVRTISMSLEREAKLAATEAFQLPPMEGLIEGATVVARPRLELEAMYYDTADLQLARWGVTLRHRTGEPGPAWTLKLPGAAAGQTLQREELTFARDRTAIPAETADLARAYVRGRALIPVARLHTSPDPIEL